jgi:energy-coupling factor transporter ATP-binding protein EcfA2
LSTLLDIRALTYRYPACETPALAGVDLQVDEGELVLVVGDSGSGKSTLLRVASGLVPHFFGGDVAGDVHIAGMDLHDCGPGELARAVGTVFQDPESQVVMNAVRAELELPLESHGIGGAAAARAVEEAALALGIDHLLDRQTATLSGGELQRTALAAALVNQPRLLLLDEPTSQLDPVAGDELVALLRRLNEQAGTTVLLAEHRVERCLPAADRVVAFDGGRIAFDGGPESFVEWAVAACPRLAPPAARMFSLAGIAPLPASVKQARRTLARRADGAPGGDPKAAAPAEGPRSSGRSGEVALRLDRVWFEYESGPRGAVLRGAGLALRAGQTVALLGRNGAGKSTLLRLAAGLIAPGRGRIEAAGEVALLVQNPGDYFLHESAIEELPDRVARDALAELGLGQLAGRDPRDLSGGERQRLALAIVLAGRGIGGGDPPAVIALDEPTRGMGREQKVWLAGALRTLAGRGAAVIAATHDVEFAAELADRCVLLARGGVAGDGPAHEVLAGGLYFATEVARVLGGRGGAIRPEEGARLLAQPPGDPGERSLAGLAGGA